VNNQVLIYQVRAFADRGFGGSPTGVVLNAGGLNEVQMQAIAKKLPVSHTAFVMEVVDQDHDINIRFFTPNGEIRNCGHATIAAHFLLATEKGTSQGYMSKQKTQSGVQEVQIYREEGILNVTFEQSEVLLSGIEKDVVQELLMLFNLSSSDLPEHYPIMLASPGANRFLIPLKSQETLAKLKPGFPAMRSLCERTDSIGCFAFTLSGAEDRWEAQGRMFAPMIGVDEDIINGNSSGCLGAYLIHLSNTGFDHTGLTLTVYQGHGFGTPGKVVVKAQKSSEKIRTFVGGTAIIASQTRMEINQYQKDPHDKDDAV